jgi:LacI family transcriptional regulator
LIKEINYSLIESDIAIATKSLLSNGNRADAIFYATNTLSMLGIKHLVDLNVKVHEDIQVICFDKNEALDYLTHVKIPYIQQPIPEMGKRAVKLLMEQIKQSKQDKTDMKIIDLHTILVKMY